MKIDIKINLSCVLVVAIFSVITYFSISKGTETALIFNILLAFPVIVLIRRILKKEEHDS